MLDKKSVNRKSIILGVILNILVLTVGLLLYIFSKNF